jgi:hypothetical protein
LAIVIELSGFFMLPNIRIQPGRGFARSAATDC